LVYEQKFDPALKSRPANMNSAMEVKTPGIKPRHVIKKNSRPTMVAMVAIGDALVCALGR